MVSTVRIYMFDIGDDVLGSFKCLFYKITVRFVGGGNLYICYQVQTVIVTGLPQVMAVPPDLVAILVSVGGILIVGRL